MQHLRKILSKEGKDTFRPVKSHESNTRSRLHEHTLSCQSSGGNLIMSVILPPGEDLLEWLSVHTCKPSRFAATTCILSPSRSLAPSPFSFNFIILTRASCS